jgi:Mn-dependent DtxR family transcriptional regulator
MRPFTTRLRTRVYSVLWGSDGLTCAEVEERLSLAHQTASARINELARMGVIKDSGERRLTPSGRAAIVWEVA